MAKDKLVDYDSTASGNLDVGGISVAEGMLPSNVNNAIREQMSHLKDFADGTEAINALAVDNLKMDGNTISSTDTNGDITLDPNGTGNIVLDAKVGIGTSSPNEKVTSSNGFLSIGAVSTTARDGAIVDYSGSSGRFIAGRAGGNYGQWEAHVAGASGVTKRYQIDYEGTTRWYAADGTTERLRIDSSGKLGLGTVSPQKQLVVSNAGAAGLEIAPETRSATVGTSLLSYNRSTSAYVRADYDASEHLMFISGTERMRLDSIGNVGIGTNVVAAASPGTNVNIHSPVAQSTYLKLSNTSTGNGTLDGFDLVCDTAGGGYVWTRENNHLYFGTNNAERMRLTSTGHLGINQNNPSFPLVVSGKAANHVSAFQVATNGYAGALWFNSSGSIVGQVQINASSTAYITTSDYRLKTAVTYDWDATTRLKQLKPARFKWIAEGDDAVFVDGFLAHECEAVPEAISGTKDAMRDEEYEVSAATGDIYTPAIEAVLDDDGNEVTPAVAEVIHSTDVERPEELAEGQQWRETTAAVMGTRSVPDYQGIDQSKLTPLLTKALIEAVEKIEALEARITALEA